MKNQSTDGSIHSLFEIHRNMTIEQSRGLRHIHVLFWNNIILVRAEPGCARTSAIANLLDQLYQAGLLVQLMNYTAIPAEGPSPPLPREPLRLASAFVGPYIAFCDGLREQLPKTFCDGLLFDGLPSETEPLPPTTQLLGGRIAFLKSKQLEIL